MSNSNRNFNALMSKSRTGFESPEMRIIGKTWLSRDIPCVIFGEGKRKTVVAGGFDGDSAGVSEFLSDFMHSVDGAYTGSGKLADFNIKELYLRNTVYIIPVANPDGICMNISGIKNDNPFYDRILKMTEGKTEYPDWKANIRGVTLTKNFNYKWLNWKIEERNLKIFGCAPEMYGGEYPESELESSSLCAFCRVTKPDTVIEIRPSEENMIIFDTGELKENTKQAEDKAKIISKYTGIKIVNKSEALWGAFALWAADETGCASFVFGINENGSEVVKKALLLALVL